MPYLLIPNEVKNQEALVWLGIANEPIDSSQITLACNGQNIPLQNWTRFTTRSNQNTIIYQYLRIPNLEPATGYLLELFLNNNLRATARLRTLPSDLPTLDESPFTVLLGSCFCSSRSESITLGSTYLNLQRQLKTDVKILCGDQVYLDDPTLHFTWHTHSAAELEDKLLSNYLRTWTQGGAVVGYQQFLQNGANFFSGDDHEFWNNAPNWATLIPDTWFQSGRDNWLDIAAALFRVFQSESAVSRFDVGTLSFFIADTRINRDADQMNFMSFNDLNELDRWITNLQGVGVLVIGQPLFSEKAGIKGKFADRSLPDYMQYAELVQILSKTNHSILLLTGDVHYGRIARCQIKPNIYLYEIISSPTALVNPAVGGKWFAAPGVFPAFQIPGVVQKTVENDFNYKFTKNHFLTLSFYRDGAKTRVIVKTVEISGSGQTPTPMTIADLILS